MGERAPDLAGLRTAARRWRGALADVGITSALRAAAPTTAGTAGFRMPAFSPAIAVERVAQELRVIVARSA